MMECAVHRSVLCLLHRIVQFWVFSTDIGPYHLGFTEDAVQLAHQLLQGQTALIPVGMHLCSGQHILVYGEVDFFFRSCEKIFSQLRV